MTTEDNARPHFEKYMRNLKMKIDRAKSGKYIDDRVDNMLMDYMCGWAHCALFAANEERAKIQKQMDEILDLL